MTLYLHEPTFQRLSPQELAGWAEIPPSIISDELNRAGCMDGGISPLAQGQTFAGHALTVQVMVGDNSGLHHAVARAVPGDVLVVDAAGHGGSAVWGEILHSVAKARRVAAVVIDGAVRDAAGIRRSGVPLYCRSVVPQGPHKGFGGTINAPISCGGMPVHPGDLLVGDDDGVAVIRSEQTDGLFDRCRARLDAERETMRRIAAGETTVDIHGFPPPEIVANGET